MRKILLAAAMILLTSGLNTYEADAIEQQAKVYICTGSSATTYHASKNCRGLSSCKGSIKEVTKDEAISMKRRPCKICYK